MTHAGPRHIANPAAVPTGTPRLVGDCRGCA